MLIETLSPKRAASFLQLVNHGKQQTFNVPLDEKQVVFLSEVVDIIDPDTVSKLAHCRNRILDHIVKEESLTRKERDDLEEASQELDKIVHLIDLLS